MDKVNAKVFLKVAECGSFVRAAKELGYTQAGISYIVAAMERTLGFPVFIRERGGVRLSDAGKELYPVLQTIENDMRLLDEKVNDIRGLQCGTVKVLIFDSISVHWLPGILKEFKRDFPNIRVELTTVESTRIAEQMVRSQQVDCGFFLHKPSRNDLDMAVLMEEKLMAVLSKEHPLAGLKKFPAKELGNYPYIGMAFSEENGISDIFTSHSVVPKSVYQLDNDYAAMAMVSANHGYCIFPELLLRNVSYDLRIMEFDEYIGRTISIAAKSFDGCSLAAKKFIEYTKKWVSENEKGSRVTN